MMVKLRRPQRGLRLPDRSVSSLTTLSHSQRQDRAQLRQFLDQYQVLALTEPALAKALAEWVNRFVRENEGC